MGQIMAECEKSIATHLAKNKAATGDKLERLDKRLSALIDKLDLLLLQASTKANNDTKEDDFVFDDNDNVDERATQERRLRRRLERNRQGMGGNRNNHHNDPYAKVKFSIPSFHAAYDAETYFDWEMTVEQKFNSHLVPEIHRVRQVTSEFKDFTIIWWTELGNTGLQHDTWDPLKVAMRSRFVPRSFELDMRKKLQHLE
jgi:hypothetical protein